MGSSAAGVVAWRASRGTVSRGIVTRGTARLLESLRTLGREKNLRPDAPGTGGTGSSADAEGASLPFLHSARQTGQLGERSSHLVRGRGGGRGGGVGEQECDAESFGRIQL